MISIRIDALTSHGTAYSTGLGHLTISGKKYSVAVDSAKDARSHENSIEERSEKLIKFLKTLNQDQLNVITNKLDVLNRKGEVLIYRKDVMNIAKGKKTASLVISDKELDKYLSRRVASAWLTISDESCYLIKIYEMTDEVLPFRFEKFLRYLRQLNKDQFDGATQHLAALSKEHDAIDFEDAMKVAKGEKTVSIQITAEIWQSPNDYSTSKGQLVISDGSTYPVKVDSKKGEFLEAPSVTNSCNKCIRLLRQLNASQFQFVIDHLNIESKIKKHVDIKDLTKLAKNVIDLWDYSSDAQPS